MTQERKAGRVRRMIKQKKKQWFIVWISVIFILSMANGIQAEAASDNEEIVKYCLYLGQTVQLPDIQNGEWVTDKEGIVKISKDGLVSVLRAGQATVSIKTEEETRVYCTIEVRANEILSALSFSDQFYPPHVLGAGSFRIQEPAFDGLKCRWSSADTKVVKVGQNGVVTPVGVGKTNILVAVTDSYGGTYHFSIPVRIINPHFEETRMNLAKGCQTTVLLLDTTGAQAGYVSSNPSILSIRTSNAYGVTLQAHKEGTATVTVSVDGVMRTCTVTVTNPKLKVQYGFYQTKKGLQVKVTGTNGRSVKRWSSGNSKIATVSQKGNVRTKKKGSTVIFCSVDGKILKYYLAVSTKKAVKAMRYGYKRIGKAHYSQARRMSKKYFDCSSFVYRCYRAAGKYLVRRASWAPVAAEIAHYYVRKGKYVKASGKYNLNKLRPGDLICFGGKKARRNGRYKRIYHIAMYIGNGKTMESSSTYNNVVIRDRGFFKKSDVPVVARP